MPNKSSRNVELKPGSNNGVEHPTATDTGEWNVDAMRVEDGGPAAGTEEEWNLDALRLSQDFDAEVGGKKLLTTVPVRKPKRQEFVRVHPDPAWHLPAALLEVEEDGESYIVENALLEKEKALLGEVQPVDLVTVMNRSGLLFLWPVKFGKGGKRDNDWLISAQEGARLAQKHWVKIASNRDSATYEITQAAGHYPEPEWPADLTFSNLLKLAFKDRVIRNMQHPVLRRLRGEI